MDKRQFLSIFQGLTLAGEGVFKPDILNLMLNQYAIRIKSNGGDGQPEKLTIKEVFAFLELYVQYIRANPKVQELVDSSVLITLTNEFIFQPIVTQLTMN
jgi:hypothetical protein